MNEQATAFLAWMDAELITLAPELEGLKDNARHLGIETETKAAFDEAIRDYEAAIKELEQARVITRAVLATTERKIRERHVSQAVKEDIENEAAEIEAARKLFRIKSEAETATLKLGVAVPKP